MLDWLITDDADDRERHRRNVEDAAAENGERRGRIERPTDILAFVLAGNSTFTLQGRTTRYTYRVRKSGDGKVSFVSVLAGPDNESDYVYVGIIRGKAFELTAKSRMTEKSEPVKAFAWFWTALARKSEAHLGQLAFYHEGRCGRCGRKLTVPASVERGIGPECAGLMEAA